MVWAGRAAADRRTPEAGAGQGLPEDFLAKYRAAPQDLQIINFEINAENAYHQAHQTLEQTQDQLRWPWLPFPLAGLAIIGVIWLAIGAMNNVSYLKHAAENPEEEDDGPEPEDHTSALNEMANL